MNAPPIVRTSPIGQRAEELINRLRPLFAREAQATFKSETDPVTREIQEAVEEALSLENEIGAEGRELLTRIFG